MTITTLHPVQSTSVDHAGELSRMPTLSAQVIYACEHLGAPGLTTAGVRTWLTDHGVEVERSYASKIVNGWRREHGLTSTGEFAALTPEMIAGSAAESAGVPVVDGSDVARSAELESGVVAVPAPALPVTAPVVDGAAPVFITAEPVAAPVDATGAVHARPSAWSRFARNVALVIPLVLVNFVAVTGQVAWAKEHLAGGPWVAVLFACALESIALFLAAETHAALMAGDSSGLLRAASYGMGCLVGALNYLHYAPDPWHPTVTAVAFGVLSTISPWLWSVRSRSMHRVELRKRGLVDSRAVKFALIRWCLFPRATFAAFRAAVWAGETDPQRAVALVSGGAR